MRRRKMKRKWRRKSGRGNGWRVNKEAQQRASTLVCWQTDLKVACRYVDPVGYAFVDLRQYAPRV